MASVTSDPAVAAPSGADARPPLMRDVSFFGMLVTQFLGAFNDNLFKQLVLLLCVDLKARGQADRQSVAQAVFAVPFVLFSGLAGWLSDRTSKRTIIVTMKFAEIAVMLAGMAAFFAGVGHADQQLNFLMVVLFAMGMHSAFFGPAKYGILPEMLRERDLVPANGFVQMTTFLAIIFGVALAGYSKDWFHDQLWIVTAMCVGIAVVGTLTSLFVRRTPVAHPGLRFERSALLIARETWRMLMTDRLLLTVLLVSSLFWFVGGVVMPATNDFGKIGLDLGDSRTSLAAACLGIGIAIGCVTAAKTSSKKVNFRLVRVAAWGIVASLAAVTIIGERAAAVRAIAASTEVAATEPRRLAETSQTMAESRPQLESFGQLLLPKRPFELRLRLVLTLLGFFSGLFVVPLQVFMQMRPPADQKGRMIGAMNLINWVGIVLSAAFLGVAGLALNAAGVGLDPSDLPDAVPRNAHWLFAMLAAAMFPVAAFFHPPDAALGDSVNP